MAYKRSSSCLTLAVLLALGGCFNPDGGAIDTDTDGTGSSNTDNPSTMTSMTMTTDPTGGMTMTESADDTDTDTTPTTDDTPDDPPECEGDADCEGMAGECEVATCDGGTCTVGNADQGVACGDRTATECDAADACDGNGTCMDNLAANGTDCSECDSGQCLCTGGTCSECVTFASTNLFTTARSLNGWTLTGDWGLYTEAPPSLAGPAIPFGNQVLGTDGNRHDPYPGGHAETSYARTPPTELPTSLTFQSWHLDEGSGSYDNKIIRISTNGGASWTDLISCPLDPGLPFCQFISTRAAGDWDSISLPLPAPLVGQVGIIEFAYDTFDSCCDFEQGWFIDVTNFATECACTAHATCEPYGGECGTGACGGNGGCNLDAVAADTPCGDDADNVCTTPDACDGFGYCQSNDLFAGYDFVPCTECEAGQDCNGCEGGVCSDCADSPAVNSFDFPPFNSPGPLGEWTMNAISGGNWGVFFQIPNNEDNDGVLASSGAPFLGIDGSTVGAADGVGEINNASVRTRVDVIPDSLTFESWHQDQGGPSVDIKRIELSLNGGGVWIPLADCSAGAPLNAFPFCSLVDNRDPENWDSIAIDTSEWADMEGELRFSYNTVNACCGFERGWFIDDLNFAQPCDAPNLSQQGIPCEFLPEDFCDDDSYCAWDDGDSTCLSCVNLSQADCGLEPLCEWKLVSGGGFGLCQSAPE